MHDLLPPVACCLLPAASLATWRPFLDPLHLHALWWAFLLPLALGVSFTYKAVRVASLSDLLRQVAIMTAQIILGMILLGAAAFCFLEYVLPYIAPR